MSVFAGCFLLGAFITGKYILKYIDRLTCCVIGAVLIIMNLCGLGSLYYVKSKNNIIYLAMAFQVLGGLGKGLNHASGMAIVSSYECKKMEYISYLELSCGLGALFGPLLGSCFHLYFGFRGPFYGLASIYMSMIISFTVNLRGES